MHCKGGSFFLLFLIIFPSVFLSSFARGEEVGRDGREKAPERGPSLIERAIGITGEGFNSRWDSLKTWVKMGWMNLHPPDAGFGMSGGSSAQVAKEAATRSFETSRETAEHAAASAAKAAGDVVEKTKEKLKRTVSGGDPDAEL